MGTAFGVSAAYMAAALHELGRGKVTTLDHAGRVPTPPPEGRAFARCPELLPFVEFVRSPDSSYVWWLARTIEAGSDEAGNCEPAFNFCYLDGAHDFTIDGLATYLTERLTGRRRSASAAGAIAMAACALAGAGCGGDDGGSDGDAASTARQALAMLRGVPQTGNTLGDPDAPASADLYMQVAAINGNVTQEVLPALVSRYVRPGRLKLQLRTVTAPASAGLDDGGARVARVAQAVGLDGGGLWNFFLAYDAAFTGVSDEATLREGMRLAGVEDVQETLTTARDPRIAGALQRANERADDASAQPASIVVTGRSKDTRRIDLSSYPTGAAVVRQVGAALG